DVGTAIDALARSEPPELLGRAVLELSDEHAGLRLVVTRIVPLLGHAEIDDLDALQALRVARDHEILGTDISVDDAGTMNGFQSAQSLHGEAHGGRGTKELPLENELPEVRSFDVLPDHVEGAVGQRGEIEQRRDVGVLDARGQARLAEEAVVRVL